MPPTFLGVVWIVNRFDVRGVAELFPYFKDSNDAERSPIFSPIICILVAKLVEEFGLDENGVEVRLFALDLVDSMVLLVNPLLLDCDPKTVVSVSSRVAISLSR